MKIGVISGDGIGPEITEAACTVLAATRVPLEYESISAGGAAMKTQGHPLPAKSLERLRAVRLTLKAPLIVKKLEGRLTIPQADGTEVTYPSLNNALRRELALFVNPRPIRGFPRVSGRYENLDVVIMREITEDIYVGRERQIGDHAAEAIKLITRDASLRVARFSFNYARTRGRRKVTCLHKANVLNYTDGLFLRCCHEVAADFPDITFDDLMIDAACYRIVRRPEEFDVVVCPNQYGDIFSDLAAGLVGSLGLAPGANIGEHYAVFEASHGAAPDIAGRGIANPIAFILSAALLLEHVGETAAAAAVASAVHDLLATGDCMTPDLGGKATTREIATDLAARVHAQCLTPQEVAK